MTVTCWSAWLALRYHTHTQCSSAIFHLKIQLAVGYCCCCSKVAIQHPIWFILKRSTEQHSQLKCRFLLVFASPSLARIVYFSLRSTVWRPTKCETSELEQNFHFHFEEQDFPRSIADFWFDVDKLKANLIYEQKKVGKQIDFFPFSFCSNRNCAVVCLESISRTNVNKRQSQCAHKSNTHFCFTCHLTKRNCFDLRFLCERSRRLKQQVLISHTVHVE